GRRWTNDQVSSRLQHGLTRAQITRIRTRDFRKMMNSPGDTTKAHMRLVAEWNVKSGVFGHRPFQKNDDFVKSILDGKLRPKPFSIERLEERAVVFADGSRVEADVIMCCTGYQEGTPPTLIGDVEVVDVRGLFRHMFHPDLGARFAFIGWARPAQGGVPACSEMQARYFSLLCSRKRTLPESSQLWRLIAHDREYEERSFFAARNVKTLCSYTAYMDALAELVDCKPRLWRLIVEPALLYRLLCASNI